MNHTLVNDLIALAMDVPPILAAQWGVWFVVGLALSVWGRREKARLVIHTEPPHHKSGVRHSSGVRPPKAPSKPAPLPPSDAFSEFEAMLDAQDSMHRTPGDAFPAPKSLP